MKLAEALMIRADYQNALFDLQERIQNNVKVQEGEQVTEDPITLMKLQAETFTNLEVLMGRINKTNATIMIDEQHSLEDLITKRNLLKKKLGLYSSILNSASSKHDRITRTEIKYVLTVDVASLQKEVDALSQTLRKLNVQLQEINWSTELL